MKTNITYEDYIWKFICSSSNNENVFNDDTYEKLFNMPLNLFTNHNTYPIVFANKL